MKSSRTPDSKRDSNRNPLPFSERLSAPTLLTLGIIGVLVSATAALDAFGFIPAGSTENRLSVSQIRNWGLMNTQGNSHISAVDAWKIEEGSSEILVAVIDTGIDPNHPDLARNVWREGKKEKVDQELAELNPSLPGQLTPGISRARANLVAGSPLAGLIGSPLLPKQNSAAHFKESHSGRLNAASSPISSQNKSRDSGIFGWNFVNNQANPLDDHGHGTHVAGIIGAVANPRTGVSGVAHRVSILPIKYYSDSNPGSVNLRNTVRAIHYAIDKGARIINYSGGGPEFSEEEFLAIKRAESKGILVVSAAGNENQNTDLRENFYYPAAYRLKNIISVAATNIHNQLLTSSNWGKRSVDVAAPGENIYSTLPGGRYGTMSGTSQATAFVTGIAALLLSKNPSLKPEELKEIIMHSVDRFPQIEERVASGGRVNAYRALKLLLQKQPSLAQAPSVQRSS